MKNSQLERSSIWTATPLAWVACRSQNSTSDPVRRLQVVDAVDLVDHPPSLVELEASWRRHASMIFSDHQTPTQSHLR
jgi:hypothetical protein